MTSSYECENKRLNDASKEKQHGFVDLNLATAVAKAKGGLGFEIKTPGRVWLFVADDEDMQASWVAAVGAVIDDVGQVRLRFAKEWHLSRAEARNGVLHCRRCCAVEDL
eukprot:1547004-Pleurochrysis_carterae.AAC.2